MTRNMRRMGMALGVATAVVALTAGDASAQLIAADSYKIGSNLAGGEYPNNTALSSTAALGTNGAPAGPTVLQTLGFQNGRYGGGSGTSNFQAQSGGLTDAVFGADAGSSGKVRWIGAFDTATIQTRSTARTLSPGAGTATTGTFWVGQLFSRNAITSANAAGFGYVLSGFANAGSPDLNGAGTSNLRGLLAGFANSTGDLVLRYRNTSNNTVDQTLIPGANLTAGATYSLLLRVDLNTSGLTDTVQYWVNATDATSEATLNSTAAAFGTLNTDAFLSAGDFVRLNYYARQWDNFVDFDEPRLGTTLASVTASTAAVPEPGTLALAFAGIGSLGLVAARRRRAKAA